MTAPTSTTTSVCTLCKAPVLRIITEGGRRIDLDPDPHEDGTVVPVKRGTAMRAHILGGSQLPADGPAWRQHSTTCRESPAARKRRAAAAPRCVVCLNPMDDELAELEGWKTHPCCDPKANADTVRAALERATAPPEAS